MKIFTGKQSIKNSKLRIKRNRLLFLIFNSSFLILLLILSSCSKTLYVPVESVRTEYKDVLLRDSVYVSDSVVIRAKNDTVWYEKYKIYYKDRLLRDSIIVTDSVQVPYPVEVEREVNQLTGFQHFQIWTGRIAGLILILWIIFRLRKK
jgi:hypothetical protein